MKKNIEQNHDQQYLQTYTIENLEKMLAESRTENQDLNRRIEELQQNNLNAHEKRKENENKNELKWIANTEKLMDQSSKFLIAMKKLQKIVSKKGNDKGESDQI